MSLVEKLWQLERQHDEILKAEGFAGKLPLGNFGLAATELERLTAENARLRGLIEPTEANVERVARAMCSDDPGVRMGDAEKVVQQRVNVEWRHYVPAATAALNALDPET